MVATGEKFGAGGGADGLDEKTVEAHAAGGDGVDVGRADGGVAVETVIAPAGVVGEEDDDVGRARRVGGGGGERDGELERKREREKEERAEEA
jgi:hypothetical protein